LTSSLLPTPTLHVLTAFPYTPLFRTADEDVRPVTRAPQRALGHGKVVADDLQLGDAGFREVDLARVRDRDLEPEQGLLPGSRHRSEEQRLNSSHVANSYAVFCLKKKL